MPLGLSEKNIPDSIILRFMSDFNSELVEIKIGQSLFTKYDSLKSDLSIGYATAIKIPVKKSGFTICLRGIDYHIPYNSKYRYIDVCIDQGNKMTIEYNNSFLGLS